MSRATKAVEVALGALRRNPLRAALTSFGILVGVAAVTIVVALGEGAERTINARIDSMGQNAYVVQPQEPLRSGVRDDQALPLLTEDDSLALERDTSSVARAVGIIDGFSRIAWRDANTSAQLIGTSLGFFEIRAWGVRSGTLWEPALEKLGARVCVIGESVAREIFGSLDPVGRSLRIGRHPFLILGILQEKGQTPFGQDQDNVVVLPLASMRAKIQPTRPGAVNSIILSARLRDDSERVTREATAVLRQRHHVVEGAEADFRIRSQDDFRQAQTKVLNILKLLLFCIAGVSLLVGGIGVMNIMLVSVTERTREVGTRMAIGARETDILLQFLIEAIVLALLGGAAGAVVASGALVALASWLDWQLAISPVALGTAFGTSSLIGVIFGFLPARRAARLDPIQALHQH